VSPPPGWSFEPNSVELNFDGKTDICSLGEDVNFVFTVCSSFCSHSTVGRQTFALLRDLGLPAKLESKAKTVELKELLLN
jgi:hypothetical protein